MGKNRQIISELQAFFKNSPTLGALSAPNIIAKPEKANKTNQTQADGRLNYLRNLS